ncbi:MAG TPA: hypothetical protein VFS44_08855 [Gemmatimonadaceae bacterium]|nr:hypothetical protein [Gemmatimonadaceae bacterium]
MTVPEHAVYYMEVVTNDVSGARTLYHQVYGWDFQAMGPELGNSFVAELPDGSRCGIRAPMHEQERPIVRTYIRVNDIERAARRVEALGGMLALPPMEIPGHGTIAIYIMAGGIEQGLWQLP